MVWGRRRRGSTTVGPRTVRVLLTARQQNYISHVSVTMRTLPCVLKKFISIAVVPVALSVSCDYPFSLPLQSWGPCSSCLHKTLWPLLVWTHILTAYLLTATQQPISRGRKTLPSFPARGLASSLMEVCSSPLLPWETRPSIIVWRPMHF